MIAQLLRIFRTMCARRFVLWYTIAIVGTVALVVTGLDWQYAQFVYYTMPPELLFAADIIGFIIPIVVLGYFAIRSTVGVKRVLFQRYYRTALYAIVCSWLLATILKVFTGRSSPPHHHGEHAQFLVDTSYNFQFGFLQESIMGGWPSAHTAVMVALAVALLHVLPRRWYNTTTLLVSAIGIGVGITFGFHWLSEFVAGACLGLVVGIVVGERYKNESATNRKR